MDASALGLAVIPPALAMIVEWLNPLSEYRVQTSAEIDLAQFHPGDDHHLLIERATFSTAAAVEIAGLAPTLVSAITSGFAILHEIPEPFWITILYVLFFIVVALGLLRILAGRTFYEIQITPVVIRWKGRERALWKRSEIVSLTIYTANTVLIILAVTTYMVLEGWRDVFKLLQFIWDHIYGV
jgi:hypothetical protein